MSGKHKIWHSNAFKGEEFRLIGSHAKINVGCHFQSISLLVKMKMSKFQPSGSLYEFHLQTDCNKPRKMEHFLVSEDLSMKRTRSPNLVSLHLRMHSAILYLGSYLSLPLILPPLSLEYHKIAHFLSF